MAQLNLDDHSHRRLNVLTGEWIQVSPHRAKRPWQGQVEETAGEEKPEYDPTCYLCPGNERAGGAAVNPKYEKTFAFVNDFSALKLDAPSEESAVGDLLVARGEPGICKVICFSPRHDLTLPQMEVSAIRTVVDLWVDEFRELGAMNEINYVQIFENKGEIMGCSNPHPHGQIWAQHTVPDEPAKESRAQKAWLEKRGADLLGDYLALELEKKTRVILENDSWVWLTPFWATWPFETMIVPRERRETLLDLTEKEKDDLADIMKRSTSKYDNLFKTSFPYSAGFHQAPTDGEEHPEWRLHFHFYPPLLRSATVKKFMVGYEMLANPQRDITAEKAAAALRDLPTVRYR
jgi:UDPglucose--hexose-1-phosphate uridylyltransferase